MRARRGKPPEAMRDLHDLTRVNVNRILFIAEISGTWIVLFGSAFLTALAIAAFRYDIEFAQALILLIGPLAVLGLLSFRTARIIRRDHVQDQDLVKRLIRHRFVTQLIGVLSIFVTAMYGMWVNLYVGPFGGF